MYKERRSARETGRISTGKEAPEGGGLVQGLDSPCPKPGHLTQRQLGSCSCVSLFEKVEEGLEVRPRGSVITPKEAEEGR